MDRPASPEHELDSADVYCIGSALDRDRVHHVVAQPEEGQVILLAWAYSIFVAVRCRFGGHARNWEDRMTDWMVQ